MVAKYFVFMFYAFLVLTCASLGAATIGQLFENQQDASAAASDAALGAAAQIVQSGTSYVLDTSNAEEAGQQAYNDCWALQNLHGLTTPGTVTISVYSDHVAATDTATFVPLPLYPLRSMFPKLPLPAITITRTGTAAI